MSSRKPTVRETTQSMRAQLVKLERAIDDWGDDAPKTSLCWRLESERVRLILELAEREKTDGRS